MAGVWKEAGIAYHSLTPRFIPGFCVVCVAHLSSLMCYVFLFCLSSFCVWCTQLCRCLWMVHSWLPRRFSLKFIHADDAWYKIAMYMSLIEWHSKGNTKTTHRYHIYCARPVSGITFIGYSQCRKIGKTNNIKVFGSMIIKGFKQDIQHRLNKIWEDCVLQTSVWALHKLYTIEWFSNVTHDMSALNDFTRDYYIHTMSDTHGMIRFTLNERKTEYTSKTRNVERSCTLHS